MLNLENEDFPSLLIEKKFFLSLVSLGALFVLLGVFNMYMMTPTFDGFRVSGHPVFYMITEAFLAFITFFFAFIGSIAYLIKKKIIFDILTVSSAKVGILASILTLLIGIPWSRAEWGYYWQWEPRQTMTLVMLIFYVSMILFRTTVDDIEDKAKLTAIFGIAAFATVPMTNFIVGALHPTPQGTGFSSSSGTGIMLLFIGTFCLYMTLLIITMQNEFMTHQIEEYKQLIYNKMD